MTTDDLFTEAYSQYLGMVRGVILNGLSTADAHLADDLAQETFLRLYRYRDRVDFGPRVRGLLKVMARQSIGHHFRVKRNSQERPADLGHWSFADRAMDPSGAGFYTPAATGFRTAKVGGR